MKISEIYTVAPTNPKSKQEKDIYETLDKLNINYERVENDYIITMEECYEVNKVLNTKIIKTLFFTNRKKDKFFIYIGDENSSVNTKALAKLLKVDSISFASTTLLKEHLHAQPGSASILSLIYDTENKIVPIIDNKIINRSTIGLCAGIASSQMKIKTKDLIDIFLPYINHQPIVVNL